MNSSRLGGQSARLLQQTLRTFSRHGHSSKTDIRLGRMNKLRWRFKEAQVIENQEMLMRKETLALACATLRSNANWWC